MSETGFIVIYVGGQSERRSIRYNIGDRLIVTKVRVSSNTGITYYTVTDGRTKGAWYDAKLFKTLDEIRAERLEEIGI
jgi:hypothetical protein